MKKISSKKMKEIGDLVCEDIKLQMLLSVERSNKTDKQKKEEIEEINNIIRDFL